MNTYEITFQRENGTTGTDRFAAATEAQARRDFKEVYRHGNGTITNVELVAEDAPATKEQERRALAQIKKIVDSLGKDSYIAAAFEGCFEIAEENIENDFACSMKQKADSAMEKVAKLEEERSEALNDAKEKESLISVLKDKVGKLNSRRDELLDQVKIGADATLENWNKFREQEDRAEAAEAEIVKLKAKLYDLLIKE